MNAVATKKHEKKITHEARDGQRFDFYGKMLSAGEIRKQLRDQGVSSITIGSTSITAFTNGDLVDRKTLIAQREAEARAKKKEDTFGNIGWATLAQQTAWYRKHFGGKNGELAEKAKLDTDPIPKDR